MAESLAAGPADAVVATMTAAFLDDPLYRWLYPDPQERPRQLAWNLGLLLDAGRRRGEVRVAEQGAAVAVWTAPGHDLLDDAAAERFLAGLRVEAAARVDAAVTGMQACAEHLPTEPHAVLHSLCVAPDRQGAGLAAALLTPLLAQADDEGFPIALDSSNPRNLSFYRRLGFETVAEVHVPAGGPTMWSLHRSAGVPVPR